MVKVKFNSNKSIQYTKIDELDNNDCESGLYVIDQQFSSDVKNEESGDERPDIDIDQRRICLVLFVGLSLVLCSYLTIWFIMSPSHEIVGPLIGLLFFFTISLSNLIIIIMVCYHDILPRLLNVRDINRQVIVL